MTTTTIYDQIAEARAQVATRSLAYTRLQQDWVSETFALASAAGTVPGTEIMDRMDPVYRAAQRACRAHSELAIATGVLEGLLALAERNRQEAG